ncbi:MAG: flagellar basal body P-ring formation protein FlgA [Hydrogenophaga sp.]|uniref:flagellar basal body P-ring formation chaperone FlgA n=1 Tax=Hydrogenophaga sp. TaxID=1904254 RepID=UPI0025C3875A|nr:flagellar basal body P-ring formation chaperone FlgA [Hydrogenophaga sp.]MBT9551813.1 flagellar basal body P-ring formation protein FlgA [Hydrogenophaga sp.]
MNTRIPPPLSRPRAAWLLAAGLLAWLGLAQAQVPAGDKTQLEQMARDWVEPALASAIGPDGGGPLRPEVIMGSLDARLQLTPCARIEPYLPPGTRLWGRSRVGLRCLEGAVRWNVFMPVTVKAWGPGWVLKRPVAAGSVLTQEDAELAEMDWAEQPYAVLANPDRWVGQQAALALQPGQALRQNMVRPVPAFGPGAQVRVSSSGAGFQVVVSGEALTAGIPGQSVRVRLGGGRVVTGTVRDGQTVDVRL